MDDSNKHFRLGLFVVISLILLFGILFILGGQSLLQPKSTFETYFDEPVSGLEVGAAVRYRGVPMGTVTAIHLSDSIYEDNTVIADRKSYVVVQVEITGSTEAVEDWEQNVAMAVEKGLRVQTQLAGITGQQYLSLDIINNAGADDLRFDWQPKHTYIPSAPSSTGKIIAGIQAVLSNLDKADIAQLSHSLNSLVTTLDEKVSQIDTANLSEQATSLVSNLNQTAQQINEVIANSQLDQTLANINSITTRLDNSLASNGDITKLIKELDTSVRRADAIMADNQHDINSIIRDLRITAANLKDFSENAKQNPSGILFGAPPEKIKLEESK
ncbi:MlaD family protein [Motilimonas eburnea]|uniref:MlaD family protein n=1 Tax=Motilimonas eburnea TaxID=1737488 RepID=UPI001E57BB2E|nr:MlaD family protein [Motilimonas eburnea]MCE2572650.1 MlaD family protein [Motilimonas eburnea]